MAEQELSPAELLAAYNQRFTDPVPPEAGPFQQIIPEEETYRDMAERTLAGALGDDREAYRRAGTLLRTADEIPVLGDVTAATDVLQALKDRDMVGLGIAGLGFIPGMAGMARKIRGSENEQMELPFELRPSEQLPSTTPTTEDPFSGLKSEINKLDQEIIRLDSGLVEDQASAARNNATLNPRTVQNTQENISKLTRQKYDLEDQLQDLIKMQTNADPRLQRAVDLGFDITRPVYHGTNVNFREFDPNKRGTYTEAKDAKLGFFFTDNPRMASTYVETDLEPYATSKNFLIRAAEKFTKGFYGKANDALLKAFGQQPLNPEAPQVLPLFLRRGREKMVIPLRGKEGNEYKEEFFTQELKKAQEEGYDSVTFRDIDDVLWREGSEKPEVLTGNVTIVFNPANIRSVNAEFDPAAKDSADLMLAEGGMVNSMNRFPQTGPLARQPFSRETMAPMGYNNGGSVFQAGQQSLQPSTRQDFQTFLATNPPDKYGRRYAGQLYGEDVYQDTPESFKLMAEEAGFGDMPVVYSGMYDSQDVAMGTDPITGKQYQGGSVGLQRRQELAKYFEKNPGAKEFWQSNFGEKAPPEGFGGPDQGLFQSGPQFGLAQELDTSTAPEPLTPAPAPITPPPQELDTSTAPAPITPVTPPPAPPPPLAVEAAQEQEPSVVPKEVTQPLSPSFSQYGGIGGLQGFVQFIQMLPTMAQLYQQIRGGGQGFNTPYSGFSTGGTYGNSAPYQHARSYQMGGGVFGLPDFTGKVYTQDEEEDDASAAETLAAATAQETTMPAGLNPLQQKLVASGDLQLEDLGYPKNTVKGTDPTVTSVFQTTTPAEDLIETTTETTTEPVTETTTEPVITTTTEPVIETTTEPVIETTTEPVTETTTEPLTPFETTTETTTEPVIETTTEPVIETTTEPVVDTAPLVVTEPLASEELATTTEGEPISLVPSPTEEDVPVFTVQDQPDAPDEQPFVPITGVSPDLSVNQYLDTTYQTGYPTTQGMEIKESLIPGQEYSAERLAAGEMIDVIKPDLGSGAELPSVDFSNIGFGTPEEEVETELYEKPEFISTDPTTGQDPDFASGPTPQDFLADSRTGDPINWKTVGEGTIDFLTNPLRGLEGLAINVADRIWSNRPEFFLATHVRENGKLVLDQNGKPIRRNGMGTLINRVLDKIYEERPNILFKEYINEGEEREGEVYGTLRDKAKPTEEVSDKTEAGQQTFLDRLWSGLGEGLNMMNPFKYLQGGDQQFVGEQPMFPTTTPVVTDVTFDEDGNPVFSSARFLGEIQGTNLSAAQRRQFNEFYGNLSAYDRAAIERARSKEYEALYDSMNFDAEGNATGDSPLDAEVQLLNFIDPEGKSEIPSVVAARKREKEIATMKINMLENGYSEQDVYELGQKAQQGDVEAMRTLMLLQGKNFDEAGNPTTYIEDYIRSFERAQQGGRAREAYEMASGGANRWGTARMGSIQERASGFSPASYHVGSEGRGIPMSAVPNEPATGPRGGLYEGPRGGYEGLASIVAGTGRLPAAGGSWGGLNPFFEVPQPGDPMYADYLMDTMGPGKNIQNEIQAMVERDLPFVQVTDDQGNGYLINKETGDIMYGPFPVDSTNTGGGGTGPGGGMAEGGPVVRNVGEAEGIAGLFENMMGPGRVDETERVYEYPGGTMTERVSRGSFNLRTG